VPEIGDALLFALSAWESCTWQAFRRAIDALQARSLAAASPTPVAGEPEGRPYLDAARALEALGHCDVAFDGENEMVFTAPSLLARLPLAGLPRAVLCGSRSPGTIEALREAARSCGEPVRVGSTSQARHHPFAPARIEVQATSEAAMRELAARLGVAYAPVPPAWSLVTVSGSVEEFLSTLEWSERPDLNWPSSDFDPARLRFAGRAEPSLPLILRRYHDPVHRRPAFWIWQGSRSARVGDPSWGRYAVLAAAGRRALTYDPVTGSLEAPATVPLPRLLSRAAALCSGFVYPSTGHPAQPAPRSPKRCHLYRDVPPDLYGRCAEKLGQMEEH
jgi:hypothetical protein